MRIKPSRLIRFPSRTIFAPLDLDRIAGSPKANRPSTQLIEPTASKRPGPWHRRVSPSLPRRIGRISSLQFLQRMADPISDRGCRVANPVAPPALAPAARSTLEGRGAGKVAKNKPPARVGHQSRVLRRGGGVVHDTDTAIYTA